MSNNEIITDSNNSLLSAINELICSIPLDDVKTSFNAKTGTASITGHRNGVQYTTTLSKKKGGLIRKDSMFYKDMGRDALADQIKELKNDGYKQTEIADMLGVSQPTVSKYLRR